MANKKDSRGGKRGSSGGGGLMLPAVIETPIGKGAVKYEIEEPSYAKALSIQSYKDSNPKEYQEVMRTLKNVEDQYGVKVTDCKVVTDMGSRSWACFTGSGELHINASYFNSDGMEAGYLSSIKRGFHPSKGDKTGLEACIAHELGHKLTHYAANKENYGWNSWYDYHELAGTIVRNAAKSLKMGNKMSEFKKNISGYANSKTRDGRSAHWECVAEAFSDVYCNGSNAKRESTAVYKELMKYLP